jgi:hypothetical protein
MAEDTLQESLNDEEVLKDIIKKTIVGICDKNIIAYPNIIAYGNRSEIDKDKLIEKTLSYMTNEIMPMNLDTALNMVDSELIQGFSEE